MPASTGVVMPCWCFGPGYEDFVLPAARSLRWHADAARQSDGFYTRSHTPCVCGTGQPTTVRLPYYPTPHWTADNRKLASHPTPLDSRQPYACPATPPHPTPHEGRLTGARPCCPLAVRSALAHPRRVSFCVSQGSWCRRRRTGPLCCTVKYSSAAPSWIELLPAGLAINEGGEGVFFTVITPLKLSSIYCRQLHYLFTCIPLVVSNVAYRFVPHAGGRCAGTCPRGGGWSRRHARSLRLDRGGAARPSVSSDVSLPLFLRPQDAHTHIHCLYIIYVRQAERVEGESTDNSRACTV